ncbi:Transposable element Tc3 transposase [Eumeta japonica]|uniref:Transposable element Tc3 transposase n=1 Tax=Eumeta variegata TaxID=151549 RepID=A0A4C1SPK0_EUMVA|nr:Transposable element Tc3 transposase [Eumeta japonica]
MCTCPFLKKTSMQVQIKWDFRQSPDLNPIENLWAYLEEKIREHNISSKTLLKQALLQEWEKILEEMCRILVESMSRRLTAVCNNNGYG